MPAVTGGLAWRAHIDTAVPKTAASTRAPDYGQALHFGQRRTVYVVCALAGIVEGFGLQSGGVAAPKFALDFHMRADYVGVVFLMTSLGLALGAGFGGWWGDRVGAGRALAVAVLLFGIASNGSALAPTAAVLTVERALAGVGLGGALPNMIALLTQTGPASAAPRRVTLSIAGISVGSLLVALLVSLAPATLDWRVIFQLGGGFAIATAVLIVLLCPRDLRSGTARTAGAGRTLGRWRVLLSRQYLLTTMLFWFACFVTAATSYLLLNWLPTFLVRSGMHQHEVGVGMIGLAVGAAAGPVLLAGLLRPGRTRLVVWVAYAGIVLGLLLLINVPKTILYVCGAIAFTGFFTGGAQAVLFGIVGPFYPDLSRGTAVGAAVAAGRIGSGVGPALAGVMLAAGLTQEKVFAAAVPLLVLALAAVLAVLRRPPEILRKRAGAQIDGANSLRSGSWGGFEHGPARLDVPARGQHRP